MGKIIKEPKYITFEISYDGQWLETIQATTKKNVVEYIRDKYIDKSFENISKFKRYALSRFKIEDFKNQICYKTNKKCTGGCGSGLCRESC